MGEMAAVERCAWSMQRARVHGSHRAEAFAGIRDLDSLRVEHAFEVPTTPRPTSTASTEPQRSTEGCGQVAILIRPVPITEIERTANEGLLMPPKSTFFAPKPKTGIVFRSL